MKKPDYCILKLTLKRLRYYFVVFFVFLVLLTLATVWLLGKINESKTEINRFKRLSLVNLEEVDHETVMQLTKDANRLGTFLPDELDLYQVNALTDQIAKKTKFSIQSFSLKAVDIPENKLYVQPLNLVGSGTLEQLMAFIEEYKFITGRIITIDSVNLSGDRRVLSNLAVNIYAYKPVIEVKNEPIRKLDEIDQYILKQIQKYYETPKKEILDTEYSTKQNPFN